MAPINPSRGESHYNHKLTDHECRLVLELVDERNELLRRARELTDAKIAEKFDICAGTVWKIGKRMARIDAITRAKQMPLIP